MVVIAACVFILQIEITFGQTKELKVRKLLFFK